VKILSENKEEAVMRVVERHPGAIGRSQHATRIFWPLTDCLVADQTDIGACLHIASAKDVPDYFDLMSRPAQPPRPCKVMWRADGRIGVAFLDDVIAVDVPCPAAHN
jgi:hypothetical protein